MRRVFAIGGSIVFLLIAPGTVAGVIPWEISHWRMQPPLLGLSFLRVVGASFIGVSIPMLLDSFARFALRGIGTPAPVFPPKHLVVTGLYRNVRNPMYVAALGVIQGQGLLLGDVRVLGYGALVWLISHLFVIGYEEPTLRKRFASEYEAYRASVPRWIPRLSPWGGEVKREL
jgi:protein-S-isoprenylcysteine O-methyltransferase Ste14